jgi:YgiT-type zinc finger domain-containing protein
MGSKYSDCRYCGGNVVEKRIVREVRWAGALNIIENVPAGVCTQCGEKVLRPSVAKAIDGILEQKCKPAKTVQVPVFTL